MLINIIRNLIMAINMNYLGTLIFPQKYCMLFLLSILVARPALAGRLNFVHKVLGLYRLTVRTKPSQGLNRGSIPRRVTI